MRIKTSRTCESFFSQCSFRQTGNGDLKINDKNKIDLNKKLIIKKLNNQIFIFGKKILL